MLQSFDCIICCMSDRCNGGRGLYSYITAYLTEIPLCQHADPRSVAPFGCSHGQRFKEELCDVSLL